MNQKHFLLNKLLVESTGIGNYLSKTDLRGVANTSGAYPKVSEGVRMSVIFSGNYVKENKVIYRIKSAINNLHCLQARYNKVNQKD